jgi:hypothetical protein
MTSTGARIIMGDDLKLFYMGWIALVHAYRSSRLSLFPVFCLGGAIKSPLVAPLQRDTTAFNPSSPIEFIRDCISIPE